MTDESNANTYDEHEEQISIQIETRIFFRMAMKVIIPCMNQPEYTVKKDSWKDISKEC